MFYWGWGEFIFRCRFFTARIWFHKPEQWKKHKSKIF